MTTRRTFLSGLAAAGCAAVGPGVVRAGEAASAGRLLFGACRGFGDAKALKEIGFDFLECGVGGTLMPEKDDAAWKAQLEKIRALPLPLRSLNGFLPGKFRLTGPAASFDEPLAYAETACRRAEEAGVKTVVFGSGGARNAPEGFPPEKAVDQFVDFCKRLAARIADLEHMCVVLEPLRAKEANFLNFVHEGADLCARIGSPRIRLLADIFHMEEGGESADSLVKAGSGLLRHCHIAEKGTRTAPGLEADGSEFVPYFKALKQIGYTGGVSCECGWGKKDEVRKGFETALATLRKVAAQV